jgi:hypothetical protein
METQIIIRQGGMDVTLIPHEPKDVRYVDAVILVQALAEQLGVTRFDLTVGPTYPNAGDVRSTHEHRDAGQADALENAMRQIGRPANARLIADVAVNEAGFVTSAKNPIDVVRQVLRKYPKFVQITRSEWALRDGYSGLPVSIAQVPPPSMGRQKSK